MSCSDRDLTRERNEPILQDNGSHSAYSPEEDPIDRIKVRVNPIIELWLELAMHGLPVKSSLHEFIEVAVGPHRESSQLFFLCRVGSVLQQIPRGELVVFFSWWWHWLEWSRLTALRDIAASSKRRQQARLHAGKAKEHLDRLERIGDSDAYRRTLCKIDAGMSSNGKRRRGANTS